MKYPTPSNKDSKKYPIPSYRETKDLLNFYSKFKRSPKHRARAAIEAMKSILEERSLVIEHRKG